MRTTFSRTAAGNRPRYPTKAMNTIKLTSTQARRLAVTKQRLTGSRRDPTPDGIVDLIRDLGCIQIDPIRAVERTQYLVLWSRLGRYDREHLHKALWKDRRLFEYWAHAASIVLTENFQIHRSQMMAAYSGEGKWDVRGRRWITEHAGLRKQVLEGLRNKPPMTSDQLAEFTPAAGPKRPASVWTTRNDVAWMLHHLWASGEVAVAAREGLRRYWTLMEQWMPQWTNQELLSRTEILRRAAQISLKALGVGTRTHIRNHFVRGHYGGVDHTLRDLQMDGLIIRAQVVGEYGPWHGEWYIHRDDVPLLHHLESGWSPRTVLLSPFDNLICDRARTLTMWGFDYTSEIYLPKSSRKYGYYVMPILHGDNIVGRIDPRMDRKTRTLIVNAVYAEEGAGCNVSIVGPLSRTVDDLARFLGASHVRYGRRKPAAWRAGLRSHRVSEA